MPVIQALAYLWLHSTRNRIRSRLRRLRQPKYLAGGLVGLLYFWFFFLRNAVGGFFGAHGDVRLNPTSPELLATFEVVGAWGLLLTLVGFWIIPSRRAALDFSEAEVQFLFSAPVSRVGLIHYKLASWQAGLAVTSLLVSLFSGRLLRGDGAWMSVLGWWMGLLLLQLHALGASFVRTWLLDRGVAHWKRRWVVALLLVGTVSAALFWGWKRTPPSPADFSDFEALLAWWVSVSQTPPMEQILTPTRWVARLTMTRDVREFLSLAGPVLLLVVVHYGWVIRARVAFEEASADAARAAMAAAVRGSENRGAPHPGHRSSRNPLMLRLDPLGVPWIGLGWKNLAAAGDWFRGRTSWVLVLVLVLGLGVGSFFASGAAWGATVGALAAGFWVMVVLVGPSATLMDLRQELSGTGWEVLKSLPLAGDQVVMGSLMTPWLILTALQWVLGAVAVVYLRGPSGVEDVGWIGRGIVFVGASMLGPSLSLVSLCLQNGAALIFPAWVLASPGAGRGGFEVLGQRLIVYVGQMLGLIIALIPAAVAGGVVLVTVGWILGRWIGIGAGSAAASVLLLVEAGLAVRGLGWLWERTDLSRERRA